MHVPIQCQAGPEVVQGRGENISISGLLVRMERTETLPEDEDIAVSFSLPGSEQVLSLRARVAHVVPGSFVGLEFLDPSPESTALIEQYVAAAPSPPGKAAVKK